MFIKTETLIKQIKDQIKKVFRVKDSGAVKIILRIQAYRIGNKIILEQSQYARKMLQEYEMNQYTLVIILIDGYEAI